ncbi:MAG TPA: cell division protein [Porticoccaceae bacterium]|nr:cell division protein [Porticoccaceae bacterium]
MNGKRGGNRVAPAPRRKSRRLGARQAGIQNWRFRVVVVGLALLPIAALWKVASLQVLPDVDRGHEFLKSQGDERMVREEEIPAYRGVISDRRGEPLAVSTAMVSIFANPQVLDNGEQALAPLGRALGASVEDLSRRLDRYADKEFMYLARRITPARAERVMALDIPGVYKHLEYKRFYPAGEVAAQLVGFTDIDDAGQEGIELAFEDQLAGRPGYRQVLKDRRGRVIRDLRLISAEKPGGNLALSVDMRLQYAAYRELKSAIKHFRARSGSVVILDVQSGEVLAMVNQPSFNPNDRERLDTNAMRNRSLTDLIEPGSIMKPLTMVAALESGKFTSGSVIDTSPGYYRVNRKTFVDHKNYGPLSMEGILQKSSQVGTTKIALALEPEAIRGVFERVGLGQSSHTGFPGEAPGLLPERRRWRPVEQATMAFGYGLAVTPLQIANAYAVLADNGIKKPVTLLRRDSAQTEVGERVIGADVAAQVREMMKAVLEEGGTGTRATIPGYEVAGKTGTSHKVGRGGYQEDQYVSLFAGMVPADNPRLVTVVVIDDPRSESYYGGLVAAPVFSKVTAEALRYLNIPPTHQPAITELTSDAVSTIDPGAGSPVPVGLANVSEVDVGLASLAGGGR